jgi:hypothetical protein
LEGESGMSKIESLKIQSRYSRKLISIQDAVALTLKKLIMFHLKLKGIHIIESNLEITFKSITDVDSLDMMEYNVAAVQIVNDIYNALSVMTQNPSLGIKIDTEPYLDLVNKMLSKVKTTDKDLLVKMTDKEKKEAIDAMNGGGGAY